MSIFIFNDCLLLCFVVATVLDVLVLGLPEAAKIMYLKPPLKMCNYSKVDSVLGAQCSKLKLHKIPLNLNVDIQMLNLIENYLRELTKDSLHPYKKLAYIYLGDNSITEIDEAAFANQPYLKLLDLTLNGCNTLPKSLFQLPYLHTLYLGYNNLNDSVFKVKVTSPLKLLQLAANKLTVIPKIGVQPTLFDLNVSNNKITSISTEDLAPFCSLKELDLTGNSINFIANSCDCQRFIAWVKLRQIKIKPHNFYNCPETPATLNEDCANVRFSNRTNELFDECLAIIQHEVETEKARPFWIYVVSCIPVFPFVLFVGLYCVHKQKKQLTANDDNIEMRQQEPANN
ncbi:leucine-rich repeat-containing protein let-4-like [Nylanderia fulva]|uniref:leucine-rich repeat-containing protein let-4-like n=1 Tax=Nylanderia fulva TaxID=613905 RepID=UPI0010FAD28D|nr:leucine-rich repeat-containing protein let-4-like [Nylanderia fulva]